MSGNGRIADGRLLKTECIEIMEISRLRILAVFIIGAAIY